MTATIEITHAPVQPPAIRSSAWNVATAVVLIVAAFLAMATLTSMQGASAQTRVSERPPRSILFDATGESVVIVTIDRDGTQRRKPGEQVALYGVRSVTVLAVSSETKDAKCEITVDGRLVSQEFGSGGGQALCVWAP